MAWTLLDTIVAIGLFAFLQSGQAQIMSIDLGHEFFKVALMRPGKALEIVLNGHSKRKTTTAVSFHEAVRVFGDDAIAHHGKAPFKVPMFFHSTVGCNYSAEDTQEGGRWWDDFGLGNLFYSYRIGYDTERGVPTLQMTEGGNSTHFEELLAHLFQAAQKMSEESCDDKRPIRDIVVTVPPVASLRQRQAIVAAAEISGLRVLTLVHEGSAFAVQRAIDLTPEKGVVENILFYNMGSRKTEVSVVSFESRSAGMIAGKMVPVVRILGSAVDFGIGGHLMDLKIADAMLRKFQEKHSKLADGVQRDPRALRKLLSQAQKTKAILSSNRNAPFNVESLFQDTDFQTTLDREAFEAMIEGPMLSRLTEPIQRALSVANLSMANITQVEVVGGAWRVPKVQQILSKFFQENTEKKLVLGQHLNGEEAAALGAALIAANSSTSFRVKKVFFSDTTMHEYATQVVSLTGKWEENVTVLYPKGATMGGKKKLNFVLEEDFKILLLEDGVPVAEYVVSGLADLIAGDLKMYNLTGPPKITVSVPLDMSGLIEVKSPKVTVEEVYLVNETRLKPRLQSNASNGTNGSNDTRNVDSSGTANDTNGTNDARGNNSSTSGGDGVHAQSESAKEEMEAGNGSNMSPNISPNASNNFSEVDVEVIWKEKKREHKRKLSIKQYDLKPLPLSDAAVAELRKKLEDTAHREAEVRALASIKNDLEAAIYGSRDKLDREAVVQVTTEEQREVVNKLCSEYEEWMYEAIDSKGEYEQRLARLGELLGPIEERASEFETRTELVEQVTEDIADILRTKAHVDVNMSWVPPNKTEAAQKKLSEFQEWWQEKQDQQKLLPLHEAPAYTRKDVVHRLTRIQKDWDKLRKLKKPKQAPAAKKPKNQTTADNSTQEAANVTKKDELSSSPADVEREIASIRDRKSAAVEKEDFDSAHTLKLRESMLVKHLEQLRAEKDEL